MGGRTLPRGVAFADELSFGRAPRDDELDVMERFSRHASHCSQCADPYTVFKTGGTLCERGHGYAREVGQYVYSKGGKAYSLVDRQATHETVQIEVPNNCRAIRGLLKAIDRGLTIKREKPVVSHDATYPVQRRPKREVIEVEPEVVEIRPGGRREERRQRDKERGEGSERYGRGSLYERDEAEARKRGSRYAGGVEPIIVYAQPKELKRASTVYVR